MPRARKPAEALRRAARILFFRAHSKPGVKGWELRRALGSDYLSVIRSLNEYLAPLGLEVKAVTEDGKRLNLDEETGEHSRAIYVVALKTQPTLTELKTSGWRIDDIAVLASAILYLYSNNGRAKRSDVENALKQKFQPWRLRATLDRLVRAGYLDERDGVLAIGWRSYAEIDIEKFVIRKQ